jgi:hypothetical protein
MSDLTKREFYKLVLLFMCLVIKRQYGNIDEQLNDFCLKCDRLYDNL